jgi:hypothetical protein
LAGERSAEQGAIVAVAGPEIDQSNGMGFEASIKTFKAGASRLDGG